MSLRASLIAALLLTAAVRPAAAAWPNSPTANLPVSTAANSQSNPSIVSDGAGGTIITWVDNRSSGSDIYAQRISAAGVPLWTADGVALCTAVNSQYSPTIISDGAGGAIVTWYDYRSGTNNDIYAQRISAAGIPQWSADGVALCTATGSQAFPIIASDGAGGAIVTWQDFRSGTSYDVYAQRISATGATLWTANGVALCSAANDQIYPMIASDGAGGAIVTWQDYRGSAPDIYAQRISAAGATLWTANGVALCTAANNQQYPTIMPDGASGAIVTWQDYRSGNYDIYAQRISATGATLWTANGVALCSAANNQQNPTIASDGAGGAIVTWCDYRSGTNGDIYTQRISAGGTPVWTADGVALCTTVNEQYFPAITSDGAGGAIVTWYDLRSGNYDIYAQRITTAGVPLWTANGVALSTAAIDQSYPTISSDGASGAIITWQDFRSGSSYDIYAQRVDAFGKLGNAEPVITAVSDVPNDQGGKVRLAWNASYLDLASDPDMSFYDIYHSLPPNGAQQAIARGTARLVHPGEAPALGAPSVMFTANGYAWEYVQSVTANHVFSSYGSYQSTVCDSVAGSNPTTAFIVMARGYSGFYWMSAPFSGYSVDNLAPRTPAPFTGQYSAGLAKLHWYPNAETDLAGYRLYRGTSTSFTPGAGNLVAALSDTGFTDAAAAPYVYKLTAIDSHGNESPVTTLVPTGTTGVDGAPALELALAAPRPNPARGSTTLEFTLPRETHVRMGVFDAAGRRVIALHDGVMAAGAHREAFTLSDDTGRELPSGLYLVRLEAEGRILTRRIAAIR